MFNLSCFGLTGLSPICAALFSSSIRPPLESAAVGLRAFLSEGLTEGRQMRRYPRRRPALDEMSEKARCV